jgi:hypothetical protein
MKIVIYPRQYYENCNDISQAIDYENNNISQAIL